MCIDKINDHNNITRIRQYFKNNRFSKNGLLVSFQCMPFHSLRLRDLVIFSKSLIIWTNLTLLPEIEEIAASDFLTNIFMKKNFWSTWIHRKASLPVHLLCV